MPLLCPLCYQPLMKLPGSCPKGHEYIFEEGVLILLAGETGERIRRFNQDYFHYRSTRIPSLITPEEFQELPYGQDAQGSPSWQLEWRLRCHDWELVRNLVGHKTELKILDLGAWNGWLSNRLAALGHAVTAVDYFNDEIDGLAAKKHYPGNWDTIQMDLEDMSVLDFEFDLIIVNRCLQFFTKPVNYVEEVQARLSPEGLMILTGLQFFRNPRARKRGIEMLETELGQAGLKFFKPIRGYLDQTDRAGLLAAGLDIRPYPQLFLANLKSYFIQTAPWHAYGLTGRRLEDGANP